MGSITLTCSGEAEQNGLGFDECILYFRLLGFSSEVWRDKHYPDSILQELYGLLWYFSKVCHRVSVQPHNHLNLYAYLFLFINRCLIVHCPTGDVLTEKLWFLKRSICRSKENMSKNNSGQTIWLMVEQFLWGRFISVNGWQTVFPESGIWG